MVRFLFLGLFVLASACKAPDDEVQTGSGSDSMTGGSGSSGSSSGSASGGEPSSGSASMGMTSAPTTGAASDCTVDSFCSLPDAALCSADPCCIVAQGHVYERSEDEVCLRESLEYVGCSHSVFDTCNYTGTISCIDWNTGEEAFQAEIEDACIPKGCTMVDAPMTEVAVCGP